MLDIVPYTVKYCRNRANPHKHWISALAAFKKVDLAHCCMKVFDSGMPSEQCLTNSLN